MSDERCFCGAEWNDVAEECAEGHPFGEEEKLRVALRASEQEVARLRAVLPTCTRGPKACDAEIERLNAWGKSLADLATHLQSELDKERQRADEAEARLISNKST